MPQHSKADWVTRFAGHLVVFARPDLGRKFARTVAITEWVEHAEKDPAEAAERWAAARRAAESAGQEQARR